MLSSNDTSRRAGDGMEEWMEEKRCMKFTRRRRHNTSSSSSSSVCFPRSSEIWNGDDVRDSVRALSPTFTWEKWEDAKLPRNKWTPHIHFRGTSFSHYIAINSTGCGLYLVCSWSRPRDMRLLTHDSSLIFTLAPHHICPKTNLFLSENENSSSPNHGIRQRGMLAYAADKLRWKNGQFDSLFFWVGFDTKQRSGWNLNDGSRD